MHQTWGKELGLHLGISNLKCCKSSLPHNCINCTLQGKISAEKGNKCNFSITYFSKVSLQRDVPKKNSTVVTKNDIGKTRRAKKIKSSTI